MSKKKIFRITTVCIVVISIIAIGMISSYASGSKKSYFFSSHKKHKRLSPSPKVTPTKTVTISPTKKSTISPTNSTPASITPNNTTPNTNVPTNTPNGDPGNVPDLEGIKIFPADNMWNTRIDNLPVSKNSSQYISTIGNKGIHPDFGTVYDGGKIGIPYNIVSSNQSKVNVSFDYDDESDKGPYPIPNNPSIEDGGDKHMLILQKDTNILYELYAVNKNSNGTWSAGSGAIWNLNKNEARPEGWTSADASGLAIFPGLVRYDEVYQKGEINHALRITLNKIQKGYIRPASHSGGTYGSDYPPMGLRLRLKANYDISKFDPKIQVVLRALKKYGLVVADIGSNMYLTGTYDSRWNDELLSGLAKVTSNDFETVDTGNVIPYK